MLIAAAVILVLTGIAHSYLGERYILMRLFRTAQLPRLMGGTAFTAGTLRFVWHLLTLVWWGVAVLVVKASSQALDTRLVLHVFSVVALLSALFPIVFTRGRHLSWIAFLAVAALLWLAAAAL